MALGFGGPLRAGDNESANLIARMRRAAGRKVVESEAVEFLVRGKASRHASAGDYSIRFTPAGQFLSKVEGPLAETVGFDGKVCWAVDMTGMPRSLELLDSRTSRSRSTIQRVIVAIQRPGKD